MSISSQIIDVLNVLCEKFGIVIDWSQQNIIPYISQLMNKCITYEVVTSITWCIIFSILYLISHAYSIKFHKKALDKEYDSDEFISWVAIISWIVFALVSIVSLIVFICQVFDIVECLVFPEKYFMNFVSGLYKSIGG